MYISHADQLWAMASVTHFIKGKNKLLFIYRPSIDVFSTVSLDLQKKKKKKNKTRNEKACQPFSNMSLISYGCRKYTKEFCCICLVNQILCALQK